MSTVIEQRLRRRFWANRLSRWTALLFFAVGTFFYAIDSDIAKFLLPIRSISFFSLLIAAVLFAVQLIEFRRFRGSPPIVVTTGLVLSLFLAAFIYIREFDTYREIDLAFRNENTTLAGTLYLPKAHGQYPAVVIAQGSIKAPRRLYHVWADILVRNGIAVYSFDKRGTGDSEGKYESENNSSVANLKLLASDVAAALRMIAAHPEVDSNAVGIVGVSMGGWLAPIAADSLRNVAFMVLLSGPTVSVEEENYFSRLTGEGHTNGAGLPNDSVLTLVARFSPGGYDPRSTLGMLNIPALWIFGAHDLSIPVIKSTAVLDSLISSGHQSYRYIVYDRANHLLVQPDWPYDFPESFHTDLIGFIRTSVAHGAREAERPR